MSRPGINRSGEIEVFVRVVDRGTLTAAANFLGMTPSAVSKLIGRLEDQARRPASAIARHASCN